ncbi:hypothetical protein T439DRAFT_329386 [Meredithblackwellia eburnea MCA 4105]
MSEASTSTSIAFNQPPELTPRPICDRCRRLQGPNHQKCRSRIKEGELGYDPARRNKQERHSNTGLAVAFALNDKVDLETSRCASCFVDGGCTWTEAIDESDPLRQLIATALAIKESQGGVAPPYGRQRTAKSKPARKQSGHVTPELSFLISRSKPPKVSHLSTSWLMARIAREDNLRQELMSCAEPDIRLLLGKLELEPNPRAEPLRQAVTFLACLQGARISFHSEIVQSACPPRSTLLHSPAYTWSTQVAARRSNAVATLWNRLLEWYTGSGEAGSTNNGKDMFLLDTSPPAFAKLEEIDEGAVVDANADEEEEEDNGKKIKGKGRSKSFDQGKPKPAGKFRTASGGLDLESAKTTLFDAIRAELVNGKMPWIGSEDVGGGTDGEAHRPTEMRDRLDKMEKEWARALAAGERKRMMEFQMKRRGTINEEMDLWAELSKAWDVVMTRNRALHSVTPVTARTGVGDMGVDPPLISFLAQHNIDLVRAQHPSLATTLPSDILARSHSNISRHWCTFILALGAEPPRQHEQYAELSSAVFDAEAAAVRLFEEFITVDEAGTPVMWGLEAEKEIHVVLNLYWAYFAHATSHLSENDKLHLHKAPLGRNFRLWDFYDRVPQKLLKEWAFTYWQSAEVAVAMQMARLCATCDRRSSIVATLLDLAYEEARRAAEASAALLQAPFSTFPSQPPGPELHQIPTHLHPLNLPPAPIPPMINFQIPTGTTSFSTSYPMPLTMDQYPPIIPNQYTLLPHSLNGYHDAATISSTSSSIALEPPSSAAFLPTNPTGAPFCASPDAETFDLPPSAPLFDPTTHPPTMALPPTLWESNLSIPSHPIGAVDFGVDTAYPYPFHATSDLANQVDETGSSTRRSSEFALDDVERERITKRARQ